jgi:hypothetical protein
MPGRWLQYATDHIIKVQKGAFMQSTSCNSAHPVAQANESVGLQLSPVDEFQMMLCGALAVGMACALVIGAVFVVCTLI